MDQGARECDIFPSFFSSYSTEIFIEELLCVSDFFGYRKILCLRSEYHDFLKKICFLTVLKIYVEEPFSVSN